MFTLKSIHPIMLKDTLVKLGYSDSSAHTITAQYIEHPNDRRYWGTEEQTKKDVEYAIETHGTIEPR